MGRMSCLASVLRSSISHEGKKLCIGRPLRTRPVWDRRLADEWRECLHPVSVLAFKLIIAWWVGRPIGLGEVYYQEQVAKRIKNALTYITEPSGEVILRRPYHIGWFINQISMCVLCCRDILPFSNKFFLVVFDSFFQGAWRYGKAIETYCEH